MEEEDQQVKKGLKDFSKNHQWARVSYNIRGYMLGNKARSAETQDSDAIKVRIWAGGVVRQAGKGFYD